MEYLAQQGNLFTPSPGRTMVNQRKAGRALQGANWRYKNAANVIGGWKPSDQTNMAANKLLDVSNVNPEDYRGQAAIDVEMTYGDVWNRTKRDMSGMGINPNSGRFAGIKTMTDLARAAAEASALSKANRAARTDTAGMTASALRALNEIDRSRLSARQAQAQAMLSGAGGLQNVAGTNYDRMAEEGGGRLRDLAYRGGGAVGGGGNRVPAGTALGGGAPSAQGASMQRQAALGGSGSLRGRGSLSGASQEMKERSLERRKGKSIDEIAKPTAVFDRSKKGGLSAGYVKNTRKGDRSNFMGAKELEEQSFRDTIPERVKEYDEKQRLGMLRGPYEYDDTYMATPPGVIEKDFFDF